MPTANPSASIVEVAKTAGVSTATVSRVVNGLPGVKPDTVAAVQAAVAKLKYSPQRVHTRKRAQRPRPGIKIGTIAMVTIGHDRSWLEHPVLAATVAGVQRGTHSHDLRLVLDDMPDINKMSNALARREADGAVVFISSNVPADALGGLLQRLRAQMPVVWAMGLEVAVGVDHVLPSNVSIGQMAATYLARGGSKHLAFFTDQPNWPLIRLRGQAFLNAALDTGHAPRAYLVSTGGRIAECYGPRTVVAATFEQLAKRLARDVVPGIGLFVATDHTTSNLYPVLRQHGITPGGDLRLVSCDNEQVRLSGMHPRPPSIDIGAEEVGYRAVHRLLNRIERPNGPALIIQVAPRLVEPV